MLGGLVNVAMGTWQVIGLALYLIPMAIWDLLVYLVTDHDDPQKEGRPKCR